MAFIGNVFRALCIRVAMVAEALAALVMVARLAITGALSTSFTDPVVVRRVFAIPRAFLPNLVLSRRLITAYDNTGTAIVTRDTDVREVLDRDDVFQVVYEPKMRAITAGENFFLGMQDTPRYTRDVSNMRLAMRREDLPGVVVPLAAGRAAALVAAAPGRIDVPQALTLPVPAALVADYIGTPGPSAAAMIQWTTAMFWYLFIDLKGDPAVSDPALKAAAACRAYLDAAIAARKAAPEPGRDDVLARCLAMQAGGMPGMDDRGIRDNLIGLIIGCIPTLSRASVQALDVLLDRPDALAAAGEAARAGDDARLADLLFEALRFNPINPLIYRRAAETVTIARGTLRACTIPAGTMVLAANLSAMFDPLALDRPNAFRPGRVWDRYMLWGYGLHTCFGAHINRAVIPAMLKPLLARPGLRRAPGAEGRIDTAGTPFPVHMVVEFDR